ncbi:hypothetical protein BDN70DRAFT_479836 [Pholiota conissans]|uniref:Uncharacterized protein n=1 Tax=Pholiota conissans TaxID=109636 RepID=A0A9P5YMA3_9AGAR|nr:hypothetical protein BDN70DRAFT_479836 [Pholiota conissans]
MPDCLTLAVCSCYDSTSPPSSSSSSSLSTTYGSLSSPSLRRLVVHQSPGSSGYPPLLSSTLFWLGLNFHPLTSSSSAPPNINVSCVAPTNVFNPSPHRSSPIKCRLSSSSQNSSIQSHTALLNVMLSNKCSRKPHSLQYTISSHTVPPTCVTTAFLTSIMVRIQE